MEEAAPERTADPRLSWAVVAAFLLVYLATATHTVQGGDTAEFVTVAATGGVAHPPGYPVFVLLARLFAALMPGELAFRVTALTALTAAGTLGVLHRLILRWTGDGIAALVAATSLGSSFLFWHWSTVAEVLPLGALTTALVLAAALGSARGATGAGQGVLVGLAAATGIANHHTVILLLPLCVYGWLAAIPTPRSARAVLTTTAGATAGVLAGFLPYLSLLGARTGGWIWGDTSTLRGLTRHFLRSEYGSFAIPQAGATEWWTWPLQYGIELTGEFGGALWLVALVGLVAGLRSGDRRLVGVLLGSWLLCGPVLLSRFTYPTTGFHHAVVERFALQPNVLVAALVGLGVAAARRWTIWSRPAIPVALLAVNVAAVFVSNLPRAGWGGNTVLQDFLDSTLATVEDRAILVTTSDAQTFGFVYAQEVLGLRPDVAPIAGSMLPSAWYRARLLQRHPDLILEREGHFLEWQDVVAANLALRPVYVSPRLQPFLDASDLPATWPATTMLRFVRPGETLPPPPVVHERLNAAMEKWTIRSRVVDVSECDHSLECTTWDHYALVLDTLASGWASIGQEKQAQEVSRLARDYSPWLFEDPPTSSPQSRPDR